MTEQEWLASNDPARMLRWAARGRGEQTPGKDISDRKLRLFAVACCRQPEVWEGKVCGRCDDGFVTVHYGTTMDPRWKTQQCPDCRGTGKVGGLQDPRSRRAVETAERYADGLATEEEIAQATAGSMVPEPSLERVLWAIRRPNFWLDVAKSSKCPPATQAALLRCIVGNQFRPVTLPEGRKTCEWCGGAGFRKAPRPVSNPPCLRCDGRGWFATTCPWLTHNDGAVVKLAGVAYQERRWDILPLIADALEEAGCPSEEEIAVTVASNKNCPWCGRAGRWRTGVGFEHEKICFHGGDTSDSWEPGEVVTVNRKAPHPLLAHLRGPGPHARGCWVLDLLLGKE